MVTVPFRHLVLDGYFPQEMVRAAADCWPAVGGPGWVRYDSPLEDKWAYNRNELLPEPLRVLLGAMMVLPVQEWLGLNSPTLIPDASLYGGGLHVIPSGGHLDVHLDANVHRVYGWERRANAILFLTSDWQRDWGGQLELWPTKLTSPAVRIDPAFGRLVVFETGNLSYHGVPNPIRCPANTERRSLAVYWWSAFRGVGDRARAKFVRTVGEPVNPSKEQLRQQRSQAPLTQERIG